VWKWWWSSGDLWWRAVAIYDGVKGCLDHWIQGSSPLLPPLQVDSMIVCVRYRKFPGTYGGIYRLTNGWRPSWACMWSDLGLNSRINCIRQKVRRTYLQSRRTLDQGKVRRTNWKVRRTCGHFQLLDQKSKLYRILSRMRGQLNRVNPSSYALVMAKTMDKCRAARC
ncbi:hypothetical protein Tco_0022568, partial [Tanacetum coccineum]